MGNILACAKSTVIVDPPHVILTMSSSDISALLKKELSITDIHLADSTYGVTTVDDLHRFLSSDDTDTLEYKSEIFDCDDFASTLAARYRGWFSNANQKCGSALGVVWGDIRKNSDPNKPRPHAVNVVILVDEKKVPKVYLVEPQTDNLFELNAHSKCWMCVM